tara:strand:+ start:1161 stop:2321 length:1161 start_codon:yes stop_codon:yes gene_type:complete
MEKFEQEYNRIVLHIYEMMNQQQQRSSARYNRSPKMFSKELEPTFTIWTVFIEPLLKTSLKQVEQKRKKNIQETEKYLSYIQSHSRQYAMASTRDKEKLSKKYSARNLVLDVKQTRDLILSNIVTERKDIDLLICVLYSLLLVFYFLKCIFINIDMIFHIYSAIKRDMPQATSRDKSWILEQHLTSVEKYFRDLFRFIGNNEDDTMSFGLEFLEFILNDIISVNNILNLFDNNNFKIDPYFRNGDLYQKARKIGLQKNNAFPYLNIKQTQIEKFKYPLENYNMVYDSILSSKIIKLPTNQYQQQQQQEQEQEQEIQKQNVNNLIKMILHQITESSSIINKLLDFLMKTKILDNQKLEEYMTILEEGVSWTVEYLNNTYDSNFYDEI